MFYWSRPQVQSAKVAIYASSLGKTYHIDAGDVEVFRDVELAVGEGEFIAITGPSGCGKTTLLNIISGIDKPTKGSITVFDESLGNKDENFLSDFRCKNIGFVFQSYNLISTLTVAENIAFPMEWLRKPTEDIRKRVDELLSLVGLQHRADHFSFQLSGGEQQRVAFARALANDPRLMLVDEPTGNLDEKTSAKIIQIFRELKENAKTVIVATHDKEIFTIANKKLCLEEGKVVNLDE